MRSSKGIWRQVFAVSVAAALAGGLGLLLSLTLTGLAATIVFAIGFYGLFLAWGCAMAVVFVHTQTRASVDRLPLRIWTWIGRWHGLVLGMTLTGAMLGAVVFPLVGFLAGMQLGIGEMFRNGLRDGGFYALIWAPGVSFVACFMIARGNQKNQTGVRANPLDTHD